MLEVDWQQLFGVEKSLLELFIRGTVMYWFLFAIFRFVVRRDVGAIGVSDILIIVIVADAAQNALSDDYRTLTEGAVVVGTLIFWNYATNWASFRSRRFARFAEPDPLALVRDGRLLEANLRREMLTKDELMSKLREQGVERLAEVRWAFMESDGQISVRKYRDDDSRPRGGRGSPATQ
jgi:uncharacterized membrane protein YcaP (DUF421 family)